MNNNVLYHDFKTILGTFTIYFYQEKAVFLELNSKNKENAIKYIKANIKADILPANPDDSFLLSAVESINNYLIGNKKSIAIPYLLFTPPFSTKVLNIVKNIEYGKMLSYADIATHLGCRAYRAVGQVVRRNPLPLIIPCHRVIGKNSIGGFSMGNGIKTKKFLMELEEIDLKIFKADS